MDKLPSGRSRSLVPFFWHDVGTRVESYARVRKEDNKVVITMTEGAIKSLIMEEDKRNGALVEWMALLHNYAYIGEPIPPRAVRNLRLKPGRNTATVEFSIE